MLIRNKFSIIIALIIMYLSLANAHTFDRVTFFNIPEFDKFVHFSMYFGLMSVIILENRRSINDNKRLFLTGLIPFGYGVLLEIIQSLFTITRTGSVFDALANTTGIIVSILIWLWVKPHLK